MLIDTHCHLDHPDFQEDLKAVVERAKGAGIKRLITISTHIYKITQLLKITDCYKNVYCSIGTHPMHVQEEPEVCWQEIVNLCEREKIVAIGECGLDYYYDTSYSDKQKAVFLNHIKASQETQLPLVIHARNADKDIEEILIKSIEQKPFPFLLHCFSSGKKLAETALELGGYISFSGIITFKNATLIQEIASIVPLDRLLVETDAPYLAPVPQRGKRNEPSFVRYTAEKLAHLHGVNFEALATQTTKNALNLFQKIK